MPHPLLHNYMDRLREQDPATFQEVMDDLAEDDSEDASTAVPDDAGLAPAVPDGEVSSDQGTATLDGASMAPAATVDGSSSFKTAESENEWDKITALYEDSLANIQKAKDIITQALTMIVKIEGNNIELTVKTLTGEEVVLNAHLNSYVAHLQQNIQSALGIPCDQQRLIYAGKQLEEDRTISSYNIEHGQIIYMVLGGEKKRKTRADGDEDDNKAEKLDKTAKEKALRDALGDDKLRLDARAGTPDAMKTKKAELDVLMQNVLDGQFNIGDVLQQATIQELDEIIDLKGYTGLERTKMNTIVSVLFRASLNQLDDGNKCIDNMKQCYHDATSLAVIQKYMVGKVMSWAKIADEAGAIKSTKLIEQGANIYLITPD